MLKEMLELLRRLLPEFECQLVVCRSRATGWCRPLGSVRNVGLSVPAILSVGTYI